MNRLEWAMIRIEEATSPPHLAQVRELFLEYAEWLGVSLCFQGFDRELATLPGRYGPPGGRLLLALDGDRAVGCIAIRPLEVGVCEMKRLYVRPSHRGTGLGRTLTERLIAEAAGIGYRHMRLDTLPVMGTARKLYTALGFRETPAYYDNPIPGVVYMELDLPRRGS